MVNRPDSSSTRSDKSSSSNRSYRSSMKSNRGGFVRSRSGTDYNDNKNGKIKNASSLQNINKTNSGAGARGLKKYKSNGR
jgi:hypothetical protein